MRVNKGPVGVPLKGAHKECTVDLSVQFKALFLSLPLPLSASPSGPVSHNPCDRIDCPYVCVLQTCFSHDPGKRYILLPSPLHMLCIHLI